MTAWAVVPVFDEAATVGAVVAGARRHVPVLVVDDGSTDGSGAVARAAGAEVVAHARRLGKGQALRHGIAAARARGASAIVTLDGDGQHDPADLPRVLRAARDWPRAIIVGGRLADGGALSRTRRHAVRLASRVVDWITGAGIADTQSGFRVYPAALFDDVDPRRGGFVFETEILLMAAARGWAIREVPVRARRRRAARSRFRPLADSAAIAACLTVWGARRLAGRLGAGKVPAAAGVAGR